MRGGHLGSMEGRRYGKNGHRLPLGCEVQWGGWAEVCGKKLGMDCPSRLRTSSWQRWGWGAPLRETEPLPPGLVGCPVVETRQHH